MSIIFIVVYHSKKKNSFEKGIPTSVYLQGAQYFVSLLSFPIAIMLTNYTFVPVFYKLQIKTSNQVNFLLKFLSHT